MNYARIAYLLLAAAAAAHADFSYTATHKSAAANTEQTTKYYFKGDKMAFESGNSTSIMDFDAQTLTHIDRTKKSYTVSKFSDLSAETAAQGVNVEADFKQTGQQKTIGGFNASQAMMTMDMAVPQSQQPGMKMQMEVELWVSPDVPGYSELQAFYKRNMGKMPWASMAPAGNASMRSAMAELQKKMAAMHGAPVLEIVRVKMAMPGMTPEQQAQMEKARQQIEAMQKQGGPQAAAAAQMLARMGAMGGGGPLTEITMESSGFSAASLPDSVFAIPAGFQQVK